MLFLKVFEGCRHSRQLQDELLDTLEAGWGADDVSLATLSDSGMVYWLADWAQGRQELRGYARVVVTGWVLGATASRSDCQELRAYARVVVTGWVLGATASRSDCCKLQATRNHTTRLQGLHGLQGCKTAMLEGLLATC